MNMCSLLQCIRFVVVVVVFDFLTTLATWSGHWRWLRQTIRRSIDRASASMSNFTFFRLWISRAGGAVRRGRGAGSVLRGGGAANVCATCSGQFSAAAAARLCNYWQSLSCSFRAAGGHLATRIDAAPSLPSSLPASLGHLGTWLFVFQRKGKLHKSEQLNFFRAANNNKNFCTFDTQTRRGAAAWNRHELIANEG